MVRPNLRVRQKRLRRHPQESKTPKKSKERPERKGLYRKQVVGTLQLNKLIPAFKSVALSEGANVNVDETWLRYHTLDEKRKTYMWCLVNKEARIVIFFYEDTEDKDGNQKHGGRRTLLVKPN